MRQYYLAPPSIADIYVTATTVNTTCPATLEWFRDTPSSSREAGLGDRSALDVLDGVLCFTTLSRGEYAVSPPLAHAAVRAGGATNEFLGGWPGSPRRLSPKDAQHAAYLNSLSDKGIIPESLADRADAVWRNAEAAVCGDLPLPASSAMTGGPVEYYWVRGPHRVSVTIPKSGSCEWYYFNANHDWSKWEETESLEPPSAFVEFLERVTTSPDRIKSPDEPHASMLHLSWIAP